MKYVNVMKAAAKLEFEVTKLQAIVDDYHLGKNPYKLERSMVEELVNTVMLVKYSSHVVCSAVEVINKELPQHHFVGFMRGMKVSADCIEQVQP